MSLDNFLSSSIGTGVASFLKVDIDKADRERKRKEELEDVDIQKELYTWKLGEQDRIAENINARNIRKANEKAIKQIAAATGVNMTDAASLYSQAGGDPSVVPTILSNISMYNTLKYPIIKRSGKDIAWDNSGIYGPSIDMNALKNLQKTYGRTNEEIVDSLDDMDFTDEDYNTALSTVQKALKIKLETAEADKDRGYTIIPDGIGGTRVQVTDPEKYNIQVNKALDDIFKTLTLPKVKSYEAIIRDILGSVSTTPKPKVKEAEIGLKSLENLPVVRDANHFNSLEIGQEYWEENPQGTYSKYKKE